MGATVVGTGLGINIGYADLIYHHLREVTGLQVVNTQTFLIVCKTGISFNIYQQVSKLWQQDSLKWPRDLQNFIEWQSHGMLEMTLPAVQAGSSFMPGKINPTMPEFINQIAYQVCGNDVTVTMAVEGAELDMNVWTSIIAKNLFESCQLLKKGISLFAEKCIKGIVVNKEVCKHRAEKILWLCLRLLRLFTATKLVPKS